MELVKQLLNKQEERLAQRGDIVVMLNGMEIGTLQSTSIDPFSSHHPSYEVTREATFTMSEVYIDESYSDMIGEIERETSSSFSYSMELREPLPNREERRAKPAKQFFTPHQEKKNQFKKGVKGLMGGRNKWS